MSLPPDQHRAASQTQARTATIEDELHQITCDLQRSVRYHRARERFFESWSNTISFLSLLAGSSVVVAILAQKPSWVSLTAGALVAALQAAEQVTRLSSKARDHNGLAAEFLTIEKLVTMKAEISDEDLRSIRAEILTIEAREPPIKRYLDLICHNQVARSIGSDDVEKLSFLQRNLAQYLNGDTALHS